MENVLSGELMDKIRERTDKYVQFEAENQKVQHNTDSEATLLTNEP